MSVKKCGRCWAVYASDGTLICLTVYKKGAAEVVRRLQQALDNAQQWVDINGPVVDIEGDTTEAYELF
jgi:hypothetical protein